MDLENGPALQDPYASLYNYNVLMASSRELQIRSALPEGHPSRVVFDADSHARLQVKAIQIATQLDLPDVPAANRTSQNGILQALANIQAQLNGVTTQLDAIQADQRAHRTQLAHLTTQVANAGATLGQHTTQLQNLAHGIENTQANLNDARREIRKSSIAGTKAFNRTRGDGREEKFEIVPSNDGRDPRTIIDAGGRALPALHSFDDIAGLNRFAFIAYLEAYDIVEDVPRTEVENQRLLAAAIGACEDVARSRFR